MEVVDGAAPIAPQNAGSVRVVHHHDGAIFFGQITQRGQRADVAIHREDAVGDEQPAAGLVLDAGQLLFGMSHIFVPEDQDFCAG